MYYVYCQMISPSIPINAPGATTVPIDDVIEKTKQFYVKPKDGDLKVCEKSTLSEAFAEINLFCTSNNLQTNCTLKENSEYGVHLFYFDSVPQLKSVKQWSGQCYKMMCFFISEKEYRTGQASSYMKEYMERYLLVSNGGQ